MSYNDETLKHLAKDSLPSELEDSGPSLSSKSILLRKMATLMLLDESSEEEEESPADD